jgi:4'-phosphopantetheinyl transferase
MTYLPIPSPTEIHVWHRSLSISAGEREALFALLAPDERERAARFRFEKDRDAFIAGRGWLRTLLGRYLRTDARGIHFILGKHGKPAIHGVPIHFNLSHSGALAACAVTRDQEVGIDIEWIRPMHDLESIARRFFHPEECRKLLALSEEERASAFFRCWTRKEAYIKALGEGLSAPLESFEVTLAPGEPAAFVQIDGRQAGADWRLFDLDPGADYLCAVAIRGSSWDVLPRQG